MKTIRLADTSTITTATPRESASVPWPPSSTRNATENEKVASKMPKAALVTPDLTNIRSTRGESWELASCRATRVSVKTTPRNVSVDVATIPRTLAASPGLTGGPTRRATGTPRLRALTVTAARPAPATRNRAGITQKLSASRSAAQARR
jgi:hypothetical protein